MHGDARWKRRPGSPVGGAGARFPAAACSAVHSASRDRPASRAPCGGRPPLRPLPVAHRGRNERRGKSSRRRLRSGTAPTGSASACRRPPPVRQNPRLRAPPARWRCGSRLPACARRAASTARAGCRLRVPRRHRLEAAAQSRRCRTSGCSGKGPSETASSPRPSRAGLCRPGAVARTQQRRRSRRPGVPPRAGSR